MIKESSCAAELLGPVTLRWPFRTQRYPLSKTGRRYGAAQAIVLARIAANGAISRLDLADHMAPQQAASLLHSMQSRGLLVIRHRSRPGRGGHPPVYALTDTSSQPFGYHCESEAHLWLLGRQPQAEPRLPRRRQCLTC